MSKQKGDESAFGVAAGSADPTTTLAALDALVLIEMPMRAAAQSAMVALGNYQRDMALCKMQREEAAENARIMDLIFSTHSPNTQGDTPKGRSPGGCV